MVARRKILLAPLGLILAPQLAFAKNVTRSDWGAAPPIAFRDMEAIRLAAAKAEALNNTILQRRGRLIPAYRLIVEESMPRRESVSHITVHHSAFQFSKTLSFYQNLRRWQRKLQGGYYIDLMNYTKHIYLGDLPYHYVMSKDGEVAEGRELKFSAYSNTHYISPIETHVTIVLDGNFNDTHPTKRQVTSLTNHLEGLARRYRVDLANVDYHRHVANSDCPGRYLIECFPEIKAELARRGV